MTVFDKEPPSAKKTEIIRAAATLFAARGYDATSISDLSDAVGLGRGALYYHIGSKERLLYEISRERPVTMVAFGNDLLTKNLNAEEMIRHLSREMMVTLGENIAGATVFFADSRALSGEHRREIVALRNEFEEIWREVLNRGVAEGRFLPGHPLIVKGILGFFNYSYVWFRGTGNLTPIEIADLFADFIIRGIGVNSK